MSPKKEIHCYQCGIQIKSRNVIGLNKKLLDEKTQIFYCIDCLANYLEVDTDFLEEKIEEFKNQGCKLFG